MSEAFRAAFQMDAVVLPLSAILPIRQIKPSDHAFGKFRAITTSIKEVGLIEPLIVFPQPGGRGTYYILDGHLRQRAMQDLGITEALCLIATSDDAFTYNDKVSRISIIQEHRMIS